MSIVKQLTKGNVMLAICRLLVLLLLLTLLAVQCSQSDQLDNLEHRIDKIYDVTCLYCNRQLQDMMDG